MKILKPLPHAVIDYAWAGTMMAAPWLFGFHRNKAATINAVSSGAAILGLSLMTRYPLGAVKVISFPTHGVIEAIAGAATATAPWLMGFSRDDSAKWTHMVSGLGTLAVVAMTDYQAAEQADIEGAEGRAMTERSATITRTDTGLGAAVGGERLPAAAGSGRSEPATSGRGATT